MTAQALLDKLDRVRKTPSGWIACCPAHGDKHPSLTITETADGMVLVHCFTGCGIDEIAAAAGVDLADLFPPKLDDHRGKPLLPHKRFDARAVLESVSLECMIVSIAAADMSRGQALSEKERERLKLAAERLQSARNLING